MENGKITRRVLATAFLSIYLAIVGYTIMLPIVFVMDSAATLEFWIRMLAVASLIGPFAVLAVYLFYRPVAQALKMREAGQEIDAKTFSKAQEAFKSVEGFLFLLGLLAYVIGAAVSMLPEIIAGNAMDPVYWSFRYLLAAVFGLVNGVVTARMINLSWIQAKYNMRITTFGNLHKRKPMWRKLGMPMVVLVLLSVTFMIAAVLYYAYQMELGAIHFNFVQCIRHFTTLGVILTLEVVLILSVLLVENQSHIRHVQKQVGGLAEGSMDLSSRVFLLSYDDMGVMSSRVNDLIDNLRDCFIAIREQTGALSRVGEDLAKNMSETASTVEQISSAINGINERATHQSECVAHTNRTMERISGLINGLNDQIEQQAVNVNESSAAIEQMLASITSVTGTLIKNGQNIERLTSASASGREELESVSKDIQTVAKDSESLLEISSVIQAIASQTNLLSMNAAIEAAHAGDAGRGFSVVAEEIRKLAETSGDEAKKVASVLGTIKDSLDKITHSTVQLTSTFEQIDGEVKVVAAQESNIRNAMEEQSAGSKQVYAAISQLNEITENVQEGSKEMLESSAQVIGEGESLDRLATEIAASMNEIAAGTEQMSGVMSSVDQLSTKNHDSIEALLQVLSRFKT